MKSFSLFRIFFWAALTVASSGAMAQISAPINAQFEYDLKITADPAKRAAYLKQSGDAPSPYEQVFNLVKGSM